MVSSKRMTVTINAGLYESLRVTYQISRILGISPFSCNVQGHQYRMSFSMKFCIYSCLLTTTVVFTSLFGLYNQYHVDVINSIKLGNTTAIIVTVGDICVTVFTVIIYVIFVIMNSSKYYDYLRSITQADATLERIKTTKSNRSILTIAVTIILVILILAFDLYLWTEISREYYGILISLLYYTPYYLCYFYIMLIELNYWLLVSIIKRRIITLNECIRFESLMHVNNSRKLDSNGIPIVSSKQVSEIIDQKMIMRESMGKQHITSDRLTDHIFKLMKVYENLVNASNSLDAAYGFIILIILLGCFIHLLVTPFVLFSQVRVTSNPVFIPLQLYWMIGHVLRLILMVEPCHGCSEEIRNMKYSLSKLLIMRSMEEHRTQLTLFSDQLTQFPIEFSAFGLAKMDRFLITSVAGAVTTYLVILFQFK